jgi:hypothetical protein
MNVFKIWKFYRLTNKLDKLIEQSILSGANVNVSFVISSSKLINGKEVVLSLIKDKVTLSAFEVSQLKESKS